MPDTETQSEVQLDETGAMSFEDSMRAAMEAHNDLDPVVELPDVPEEAPVEPVTATEPEETPEVPVTAEAAPEAPQATLDEPQAQAPGDDKALARIMEREAAILAREEAYAESKADLDTLRGRLDAQESGLRQFELNPVAYIKSLAPEMDLKRLAENLWYENQGQEAPQKYLEQKAATRQNSALAERIAKIEQGEKARLAAQQQNDAQQQVARYQGALDSYVQSASETQIPLTRAMNSKDPGIVSGMMLEIAQRHAQATGGEVLTPDQVAGALEKRLGLYQLSQPPAPEPTPAPEQGTSLRNQSTQVQPDREPEDPLSDEYLERKALKAAGII